MHIFDRYENIFMQSMLFRDFTADEVRDCLDRVGAIVVPFKKGDIMNLPEKLDSIYFLLSGHLNVVQDSGMNASLVHAVLPGKSFGIAFCAENYICHHSFYASEGSELLRLKFDLLMESDATRERFLRNFLAITSFNLSMLSDKINHTQARSVRVKLSVYLRDRMEHTGSDTFEIGMTRTDLSNYLNITYPAMLRELSRMQKEEIIEIQGDKVRIKDLNALIETGSEYNIL